MKKINIFILALCLAYPAMASSAGKTKKSKLKRADIQAAMSQSEQDQRVIKAKLNKDKEARMNSWAERDTQAISIKNTGLQQIVGDSYESNTYDPELDGLRNDVVKENDVPDFDAELMEVEIEPKPVKKPASTTAAKK